MSTSFIRFLDELEHYKSFLFLKNEKNRGLSSEKPSRWSAYLYQNHSYCATYFQFLAMVRGANTSIYVLREGIYMYIEITFTMHKYGGKLIFSFYIYSLSPSLRALNTVLMFAYRFTLNNFA